MKKIGSVVNSFWFTPAPASRLAIIRIATGCFSLWYLVTRYSMLKGLSNTDVSMYEPVGIMQLFEGPMPASLNTALLLTTIALNIAYIAGWKFCWTGPLFSLLLLCLFCYRNSWSMIYHNFNILVLHILVIGCASSGDALSADSMYKKEHQHNNVRNIHWQYGWPIKLLCMVTVIAYLLSGIAKVSGELAWEWFSGDAMRSQVAVDSLRKNALGVETPLIFEWLYAHAWIFFAMGFTTLLVELGAPLILVNKRMAKLWVLLALLMHWGIFFIMGIRFYYQMTGIIFLSFLEPERWCVYFRHKFSLKKDTASGVHAVKKNEPSIILFDGVCNFCNSAVQFILNRDPKGKFHFASLQSETGRQLLDRYKVKADLSTIVLIENNRLHFCSSAILRIAGRLRGPWKCLYVLFVIPSAIRDMVYNFIAKRRYTWFGKKAVCEIPESNIKARFLDSPLISK